MKRIPGVLILLVLMAVPAVTQEPVVPGAGSTGWLGEGENPTDLPQCLTPADNACYTGGVLEGQCGTTDFNGDDVVSVYEANWMWQYGWVLARVLSSDLRREDFPQFFPPAAAASPAGGVAAPRNCFKNTEGWPDLSFAGASGENNGAMFESTDGSCTKRSITITVVTASVESDALAQCARINPIFIAAELMSRLGYPLSDLWWCLSAA